MKVISHTIVFAFAIGSIVCPPVKEQKETEKPKIDDQELGLQYERYLKEVVAVLEEDEGFKQKLESSNISDIKSGDIAQHLEFVSHRVRSRLDELKRKEIERLNTVKKLMNIKAEAMDTAQRGGDGSLKFRHTPDISRKMAESLRKIQELNGNHDSTKLAKHLDMRNPDSFEEEDLKKLIVQATNDLEDMDKKRRGEFKAYELEKEALRREKLKQMTERERVEAEEKFKEMKQKHKEHPKINHPGSRDQLEEVWEENDGMDKEDFDPKTFFYMHDNNGDGQLDYMEVEALFQNELDKVYDEDATEDDMMERYEEMSRMREHVYKEIDTNHDELISLEEFINSALAENFDEKEEWDTLDDEEMYTDEELEMFEDQLRERMSQNAFGGHAQPGEVHIPSDTTLMPPHDNDLVQQHHDNNAQQGQHQGQQQQGQHQGQHQQAQHHGQGQQQQAEHHGQDQQQNQPPVQHHQQVDPQAQHQQQNEPPAQHHQLDPTAQQHPEAKQQEQDQHP